MVLVFLCAEYKPEGDAMQVVGYVAAVSARGRAGAGAQVDIANSPCAGGGACWPQATPEARRHGGWVFGWSWGSTTTEGGCASGAWVRCCRTPALLLKPGPGEVTASSIAKKVPRLEEGGGVGGGLRRSTTNELGLPHRLGVWAWATAAAAGRGASLADGND